MDSKSLIERLREYTTPELCDGAVILRTMDYHIKPRAAARKIVGTAYTVDAPKAVSGIIPDAILEAKEGDVIVVSGKGECNRSYWGDHRSICAKMKGIEGVVIDGGFRDVCECENVGIPIYARAVIPVSAGKGAEGQLNVPIVCGGVEVCPGDFIVGDKNGVVVIKPEEVEEVMEKADKKISAQEKTIKKMKDTGEIIPRVLKKEEN